jgi:Mismatch repair ATPase (MutS family)
MQTQYKTPMMQQWHACKMAAPNALLLFRLGDFYEAFEEDAQQIASLLGLFLTKRQEIPMCGIPAHAADNYLEKLVGLGYRVAIAEQTEEAKSSQGLVKREIVKILSPATHINSTAIAEKEPLLFASVSHVGKTFGLSIIDLTTGLFQSAECSQPDELFEELKRLHPTELITSDKTHSTFQKAFTELQQTTRVTLHKAPPFLFELGSATSALKAHFEVTTLDAFGFEGAIAAIQSSGALLRYLKEDHRLSLSGIFPPQLYRPRDFLYLDASTMQNLELLKTRSGDKKGSLLHLIDSTKTPMGARLLAEFLRRPSLDIPTIVKRQEVGYFIKEKQGFLPPLQSALSGVRDFERIAMKLSQESPAPRDLGALLHTLTALPPLFNHLSEYALPALLYDACQECSTFEQEKALLDRFLSDTLPLRISEGGVVRSGFSPKLDELRFIAHSGKEWLLAYQERLRVETGIKTLKVGYTNAFGYYIEISKAAAVNAPSSFERRQTLAQAERFITPELKEFEYKVLRAEGEALALEKQLFFEIHAQIKAALPFMIKTARALAQIDALTSLGALSLNFGFSCPQFTDVDLLEINEGRHPVVEAFFAPGNFTPNSCKLDQNSTRLILLTGPNMAGKSTYIRQIALLVILAQIGAFVPAESMRLSLIDQLFYPHWGKRRSGSRTLHLYG